MIKNEFFSVVSSKTAGAGKTGTALRQKKSDEPQNEIRRINCWLLFVIEAGLL
jgi:hypothetical protein